VKVVLCLSLGLTVLSISSSPPGPSLPEGEMAFINSFSNEPLPRPGWMIACPRASPPPACEFRATVAAPLRWLSASGLAFQN